MSNQTKIFVLHMKELVYTAIFLALAIILAVLLFSMFGRNDKRTAETDTQLYSPGVYHRSLELAGNDIELQVVVDKDQIKDISFVNLEDSVAVMYPLLSPSLDELRDQIVEKQSLSDLSFDAESQYTSSLLLNAIKQTLEECRVKEN